MSGNKGKWGTQATGAERDYHMGNHGLLLGLDDIAGYLGVSKLTVREWWKKEGFPMAKLPGGRWATTPSAIDRWIFAMSKMQLETYAQSKGLRIDQLGHHKKSADAEARMNQHIIRTEVDREYDENGYRLNPDTIRKNREYAEKKRKKGDG